METTTMQETKWSIDALHSEIHFKVKHLLISTVTGSFKTFTGDVTTDGNDFESAEINVSIDVKSIDTNQPMRDDHLRNADFFDAPNHPYITFQSTSFKKVEGDNYKLIGNLTMRGVTKEVTVDAEFGGFAKDQRGNTKAGFDISGIIKRKEFGVSFNGVTETGGLALGEDIKLNGSIQLTKETK